MAAPPPPLPPGLWVLDPGHSSISFAVEHLGVALVWGRFRRVEAQARIGADGDVRLSADLDVRSLDTGNPARDRDLLGPDFFDAARFPSIGFAGSDLERADPGRLRVGGALSIRDVTRPVSLEGVAGGVELDLDGDTRLGLRLSGRVSRAAFGMTTNEVLHSGGVLISDQVQLRLDVSAVRRG